MADGLFEDLLTGAGLGFIAQRVLGASIAKDRARINEMERDLADAYGITVEELRQREEDEKREKQLAKQQKFDADFQRGVEIRERFFARIFGTRRKNR